MALKIRGRLAAGFFLTVAVLIGPSPAGADPLLRAGVNLFGDASFIYQPCRTFACDPATGTWSEESAGGVGISSAAIAGEGGVANGLAYLATADLGGPLALPTLKAYAAASIELGTYPGYSSDCCYVNSAVASANALQYYTYTGTQTDYLYTLNYTIDGTISGGSYASISGGLSLFDGIRDPVLGAELPLGRVLDIDQTFISGTPGGTFSQGGSVSVLVNPGGGFYLSAFLAANLGPYGDGVADASHTFSATFTQGNTGFLTASVVPSTTPVPEPATTALLIGGVWVALRRVRTARNRE